MKDHIDSPPPVPCGRERLLRTLIFVTWHSCGSCSTLYINLLWCLSKLSQNQIKHYFINDVQRPLTSNCWDIGKILLNLKIAIDRCWCFWQKYLHFLKLFVKKIHAIRWHLQKYLQFQVKPDQTWHLLTKSPQSFDFYHLNKQ